LHNESPSFPNLAVNSTCFIMRELLMPGIGCSFTVISRVRIIAGHFQGGSVDYYFSGERLMTKITRLTRDIHHHGSTVPDLDTGG